MNAGETDPLLRRLFFELQLDDGVTPATDADVSAPAGTIQICVNGAAFVNGAGTFARIASNLYYYQLTLGECLRGFTVARFSRAGYHEEMEQDFIGSVFVVGETDPTYLRYPITIFGDDPQPPLPATGATVTVGDLKISVNGAAPANAAGTMPEVGHGLYYYQGVVGDAAAPSRLVASYTHAGFAMAATVIPVEPPPAVIGADATPPAIGTVTPLANTAPGDVGAFPASFTTAKDTPIVIPVVDAASAVGFVVLSVLYGDIALWAAEPDRRVWQVIYAGRPGIEGLSGFHDGYAAHSTLTGTGTAGVGFTFGVRRDGGWPARNGLAMPVAIDSQAVDEKGNVLA